MFGTFSSLRLSRRWVIRDVNKVNLKITIQGELLARLEHVLYTHHESIYRQFVHFDEMVARWVYPGRGLGR